MKLTEIPAVFTRKFWSGLGRHLARAFKPDLDQSPPPVVAVTKMHKMDAYSEEALGWLSTMRPISASDAVEILEINVWTEGARKCGEHCWHRLGSRPSHLEALKLRSGDEHNDYACCRCTHGLCHTGSRTAWLDQHPLTKFHKREPLPSKKKR